MDLVCQQDPLPQLETNEPRPYKKNIWPSPTRKSRDWWDQTTPSSACWPKYEEVPSLQGWCETSFKVTPTFTLQYSGVLSTRWSRPPDAWRASTPERRNCLKRPLMTSSRLVSPDKTLIQSDPLRTPLQVIKKTGGKSTSTCLARMGYDALPNGSKDWMGEKWPGTPKKMPQGTFPLSPTSLPPKSTMMRMTTTQQDLFQGGSYLH